MLIPNRHGSSNSYRYGFQGQEKDDELKGEGNSLNYTFRMHDPRVGRFFAVDPLASKFPHNSPYSYSENRVIDALELEGLEMEPLSFLAKKTKTVLTIGLEIDIRAGVSMVSAGLSGGGYLAADIYDNYALVFGKESYAALISRGVSTSEKKPGPENGGSWYFGVDLGVNISASARWGIYKHVNDLAGSEKNFDVDGGPADISVITNGNEEFNGVSIGGGVGFSGGFGFKHPESTVFSFGDKSLSNFRKTLFEAYLEKSLFGSKEMVLPNINIDKKGNFNLTISVFKEIEGKMTKIFEKIAISFEKKSEFIYEANDVNPAK